MMSTISARLLGSPQESVASSDSISSSSLISSSCMSERISDTSKRGRIRRRDEEFGRSNSAQCPQTITLALDVRGRYRSNNPKRRRVTDEDHFNAFNIVADLKKAGLPPPILAPEIRSSNSSNTNNSLIDMSLVKHLTSKQYDALSTTCNKSTQDYQRKIDSHCELMLHCCSSFYESQGHSLAAVVGSSVPQPIIRGGTSDTESDLTESNFSSNENDSVESASPKPNAFEGGFYANRNIALKNQTKASALAIQMECPSSSVMTLGQALDFNRMPRIVTQAFPPYQVVHGNSGYTRLTGVPSNQVVGASFDNAVIFSHQDDNRNASVYFGENKKPSHQVSLSSCAKMTEMGQDIFMDICTQSCSEDDSEVMKSFRKCSIEVIPVVSDVKKSDFSLSQQSLIAGVDSSKVFNVTHFLIEMESCANHDKMSQHGQTEDADGAGAPPKNGGRTNKKEQGYGIQESQNNLYLIG